MSFERINSPGRWREVIASFPQCDFFHSFEYHQQNARLGEGLPVLYAERLQGNISAAFPFIRRDLEHGRFDLTSVYGYPGPLLQESIDYFAAQQRLIAQLKQEGCVTAFLRFHPLINAEIEPQGEVMQLGKTVVVELGDPELLSSYRKTTRYEIRKLIKSNAAVSFGTSHDRLDEFIEVYYHAMDQLSADRYYYFDREFLAALLESESFETTIGHVHMDDQVVASALFTVSGGIAEYFLGGAISDYSRWAPQKLLLHRAFEWAAKKGAKLMNLGGGRGSSEDGLYRFKQAFSNLEYPFKIAKIITAPETYHTMVSDFSRKSQLSLDELMDIRSFFPAYRRPVSI